MKRLIAATLAASLVAAFAAFILPDTVTATGGHRDHKVTICHKGHTITIDKHAVKHHLKNHAADYLGKCKPAPTPTASPTASPTPSVTPTSTPSVTPTATPSVTPSDTPTASPTPSVTPTTTPTASPTPSATPSATPPKDDKPRDIDKPVHPKPEPTPSVGTALSLEPQCIGNDLHIWTFEDGLPVRSGVVPHDPSCATTDVVEAPQGGGAPEPTEVLAAPAPADTGHGVPSGEASILGAALGVGIAVAAVLGSRRVTRK